MERCAYYLEETLSHAGQIKAARNIVAWYRKSGIKANAVAFTGLSGALVAPLVAARLRLPMVAVRKGEKNHSNFTVESSLSYDAALNYIVVDDLISSGETLRRIVEEVSKRNEGSTCLGVFCYLQRLYDNHEGNGNPGVLGIPHYRCEQGPPTDE